MRVHVVDPSAFTRPYDHAHPDKYRLPIDTDRIPHKFGRGAGW